MATYSELQTRIERRVIDLPSAVTTEIPLLINEALKELQEEHNFKVMEAIGGPYTTTLDTRTLVTIPSTFKEYRGNPYYVENTGYKVALDMATVPNIQSALDAFQTEDDGEPLLLLESSPTDTGSRSWEVYPLPDGLSDYDDGEYRIYVPYWRYLPDLSADGDTNWFTVNAREYVIARATAEAFALDWDVEHQTEWLQKAAQYKQRVIKLDKRYWVSGVKTLVPHFDGVNTPNIRM